MRGAKKEKLEKRGWWIGTTQEFLGLSSEEIADIEARLRVADGRRRRSRGDSQSAGVGRRKV